MALLAVATICVSACQPSAPPSVEAPRLIPLTVYASFEPDSSVLRPSTHSSLALAASEAVAGRPVCIQVWGAIDEARSEPSRDALSIRRATVVLDELMARGVSHWIITILGAEAECMCPLGDPYPRKARIVQIMIGKRSCG